jgi:hypothetical protein
MTAGRIFAGYGRIPPTLPAFILSDSQFNFPSTTWVDIQEEISWAILPAWWPA